MAAIPWWRQLRFRATMAMVGLTVLVSGSQFITDFIISRGKVLEHFQQRVETIAGTGALALKGDDLELVEYQLDYLTDEFKVASEVLEQIRTRNGLSHEEIYVLRPVKEEMFETEFVVMTGADPYIGNRYQIRPQNREAFTAAIRAGAVRSTEIYESDVGEWISAYAPIFNSQRETIAVLEVAVKVERYDKVLLEEALIEALVTAVALVFGLLAVLFLTNKLTSGISRLSGAMKRFEQGETNVQLELNSRDEIAAMGESFNEMAHSVGEKLKLLPFVSQFTVQAVEKSRYVENWLEGQERSAAILMTDVRGFTQSAQRMAPADLLNRLNELLTLQSEVVAKHGGSVDKFMGDAVLAVFSGHEDDLERATRCGRELYSKVQRQTYDWNENWSLGGAISHGKVIFGAVGSEARRDYTVIGNVVNRTAHLCGAAGAWELLIEPECWSKLPSDLQALFPNQVAVQTKHESEPKMMRAHQRTQLTETPWGPNG